MKKQTILLTLIMGLYLIPIANVQAASTGSANILMITTLGRSYSLNSIALSGDGSYLLTSTMSTTPVGNLTLMEIPESFSSESTLKWKIDEASGEYLKINADGSRMIYGDDVSDTIYCLSKDSITPLWELPVVGELYEVFTSENLDYVIYETFDSVFSVSCVSGADGSPIWSNDAGSVRGADIANNGNAIVSFNNATYTYYDSTGTVVWQKEEFSGSYIPSISNDGNFVLVSPQHITDNLTLFDSAGTTLWEVPEKWYDHGYAMAKESHDIIAATYNADTLTENAIYYFTPESETPVWRESTAARQKNAVISSNGKIALVSDFIYNIQIVDLDTGVVITTHNAGNLINDLDISDDGTVAAALVGGDTVIVYSITPSQGFFGSFLETFTNLENVYGLGATLLVGLLLGGLIFGLGKKKK